MLLRKICSKARSPVSNKLNCFRSHCQPNQIRLTMSSRRAPSSSRSTSDKNANFGVPCDSILALLCSLQRNNNSFALFIPILGSKQRGKSYSSQSESRRPNQCAAISKILSHFWWASRLFSTTSKFVFRCYPPSVQAPKTLSRRKLNTNHYVHTRKGRLVGWE